MPDEIVGGGAVASADPIRDAVANSVADAGMIDEIASSSNEVVETPPADGADGSATVTTPDATTPDAPKPDAAAPKAKTEDEELAEIEAKLVAENPTLQRGNISRSRHQAMLTRRANEHKAALEAEVTKVRSEYERPEIQERLQGGLLFEQHPQAAFDNVILNDPRYRAIIDTHVEKVIKERGLASTPPPPADGSAKPTVATELPKPDILLPDGSLGYSAEAQAKYVDIKLQQERAALQADFDKKLEDRFKALDGDLAPAREAKAAKEHFDAALTRQGTLLSEAKSSWPGFMTHYAEIKTEIMKPGNERMGLRQAYDAVRERHLGTLQSQIKTQAQLETEMRARIIAETNAAATAAGRSIRPGVPAAGAPSGDGNAPDPVRDAIARAASTLR